VEVESWAWELQVVSWTRSARLRAGVGDQRLCGELGLRGWGLGLGLALRVVVGERVQGLKLDKMGFGS
jgi:hypothetical protein